MCLSSMYGVGIELCREKWDHDEAEYGRVVRLSSLASLAFATPVRRGSTRSPLIFSIENIKTVGTQ